MRGTRHNKLHGSPFFLPTPYVSLVLHVEDDRKLVNYPHLFYPEVVVVTSLTLIELEEKIDNVIDRKPVRRDLRRRRRKRFHQ